MNQCLNRSAGRAVLPVMFDTVNGLPIHILALHAVVIGVPAMFLVTLAFVLRPKWRRGLPWAVAGNVVLLGACFVTKEAGEQLQNRLSQMAGQPVAADHAEKGSVLPFYVIGLLIASVIAWLLVRQRSYQASGAMLGVAAALVLVTGAAATWWTYEVGDSGSKSVWEQTIANSPAPSGG